MKIYNNEVSERDYKKACNSQKKFIKKYGDDRNKLYHLSLIEDTVVTPALGVKKIIIDDSILENDAGKFLEKLPPNPIIIGNIRMGFGHYRISMAMASAAKQLGYNPLWLDLNSFSQTTCTKIISYQNNLYSLGSRLSQKIPLFNKLFWEPMNYEGFKKLSYNVGDQKNAELMTSIFKEIPKDIPLIATHVWPSQAAIHAGMKNVINAIPDNWPMALHLSEGAVHTVQTYNTYWGYRTLNGFKKNTVLNPMTDEDIVYTGHYIDHEIVSNIDEDCKKRIERANNGKPVRFLLTIGGAGAQGDFFAKIIEFLLPYVKENKACIYINCGDYDKVWECLKNKLPDLKNNNICKPHFNDWNDELQFASSALNDTDEYYGKGIHVFCNKDIFAAVYITNLLMRATDILITKPSELAFYPVPKLFIRRIGGHEMWGAIHSAEFGDGTQECETPEQACSLIKMILEQPELIQGMCNAIMNANKIGIYNGAYNVIKKAIEISKR